MQSIRVLTEHPVAIDSPDHYAPWGTVRDNSENYLFNEKIYRLFNFIGRLPRILDLGCAGGGFVRSCIDDGCIAVGIEGSDLPKKKALGEWPCLGDNFLFTADITYPFEVKARTAENQPEFLIQFDLITAWEVMEHIAEKEIACICENIKRHLLPEGLVIMSISPNEELIDGIRLHQTVREKDWWESLFASHGFKHLPDLNIYFNNQFIRGPHQNAPGSFHLIFTHDSA